MRHVLNKIGLLGLCLLLGIFVVKFVSAADAGVEIDLNKPTTIWYRSNLHTLHMGNNTQSGTLYVKDGKLKITNGLVAGKDSSVTSNYGVIGGGQGNSISANYAGIGGGYSNKAQAQYAIVGGGYGNEAQGQNAVVVGGKTNKADGSSVVVGGESNKALGGGVILGGSGNTAYNGGLALGNSSTGNIGAFAWNGNASEKSAYINASNGVLIGTTTPIAGVNLVVNGAVKVAGSGADALAISGEIRYVGGCFYGFDGDKWHVLNRGNEKTENDNNTTNDKCSAFSSGSVAKYCEFGNTVVWNNDVVSAYSESYAVGTGCDLYARNLVCQNGHLYVNGTTTLADNYYPYCYSIHE